MAVVGIVLVQWLVSACASTTVHLTDRDVSTSGTAVFSSSPPQVFQATRDVLHMMGFPSGIEREEDGVILTGRRRLGLESQSVDTSGSSSQSLSALIEDAYEIRISAGTGGTVLVARPYLYRGGNDVSREQVWNIDIQKKEWREMFANIRRALGETN